MAGSHLLLLLLSINTLLLAFLSSSACASRPPRLPTSNLPNLTSGGAAAGLPAEPASCTFMAVMAWGLGAALLVGAAGFLLYRRRRRRVTPAWIRLPMEPLDVPDAHSRTGGLPTRGVARDNFPGYGFHELFIDYLHDGTLIARVGDTCELIAVGPKRKP